MKKSTVTPPLLPDGTVYSQRKHFAPFIVPPLEAYASILGEEKIKRLQRISNRLKGLKLLELNSSAQGGGVAEMLYSSIPFLNSLGIEAEWKVIRGNEEYYECTKAMHNLLQGKKGTFTSEMKQCYLENLRDLAGSKFIDNKLDAVIVHDPQPMGLASYLKQPEEVWLWRCHIDVEEESLAANPGLWEFMTGRTEPYDAAIFSAAHYIVSRWPLPKFIIPPFIDPLSEKNRELSRTEINEVLEKYQIDPEVPIITQIGRFDPWKGIDRTVSTFRLVRNERKCQLVLAGGLAVDDPEGEQILATIYEETKHDDDIYVLNLQMEDRLKNWKEVNALQRAASVIMQPSTKEGFGLTITEALWKEKPVIAADAGAIPLQIREDDTGYFYETPNLTAQKVLHLLKNHEAAREIGKKGKRYVKGHFLLPDRIADYLLAIDMLVSGMVNRELHTDCIISFHPWFKLSKRRTQ
ncbi:MAG: glycosyltransferase [Chloroflexota bacterium]|nr:MAG: glycosyltransferase [Chloroflexota bacterium]